MALKIRLSRSGAKKRPYYRIVIADSRSPRDGRFIERVGTYNPMVPRDHPERIVLKDERIKYWLGVGARPTDRVAKFLGNAGMVEVPSIPEQTKKNQPRAKTVERMKEAEKAAAAKKAEAEAAASAPVEEAAAAEPPAEEAPVEEAPAEEAAAEEAPAAEAPAEEPAVEAPAEDEPAGEPAADEADKDKTEG